MSRWKVMSMVLVLGLGIGGIVPVATSWWNANKPVFSTFSLTEPDLDEKSLPKDVYHFKLEQGVLSVIEGKHGTSGKVISTGLNVQTWPKGILDMASKVEFYSLDEVQSFFDTVNEPFLWQE